MKKQRTNPIGQLGQMTAGVFASALVFWSGIAVAQDAKPEEKGWATVANAGLSLSRGNSENLLVTAGIDTVRKWAMDEARLGARFGYGSSKVDDEENTTQHDIRGYGQYNHLFTERIYAGVRLDGLYDKVAGIHYRFTLSPLAGYYFIKEKNTTLSGEFGPSIVTEEVVSRVPIRPAPATGRDFTKRVDENTYLALRFGERFEHSFAGGAKIWQLAEWIPQVTDFENWILNFELGVSAPITKKIDARLVLQDTYDNVPALGRKKNDLKLIAGLGYKF